MVHWQWAPALAALVAGTASAKERPARKEKIKAPVENPWTNGRQLFRSER
jgi:hypothetical protein